MSYLGVVQPQLSEEGAVPEISADQIPSAWVIFDANVSPHVIIASYNVSAVVDLGTGEHDVQFDPPMDNVDYIMIGGSMESSGISLSVDGSRVTGPVKKTVNAVTLIGENVAATARRDSAHCMALFYGGRV